MLARRRERLGGWACRSRSGRSGGWIGRASGDGLCGEGCGCLQGDVEAEFFELGDQTAGSPFWVLAAGEVVVAEVGEELAGAEQVPDEFDQ
jgi:hypothetical protein